MKTTGCSKCSQLGYKGRTVINELLEITSEIRAALNRDASADGIRDIAISQGMTSLPAEAIKKAAQGEVTIQEALGVPSE